MQCLLLIALKAARTSMSDRLAAAANARSTHGLMAAESAKAQILADGDEWEAAANVNAGDGGHPVPLVSRKATRKGSKAEQSRRRRETETEKRGNAKGIKAQVAALSALDFGSAEEQMTSQSGVEEAHSEKEVVRNTKLGSVDEITERFQGRLRRLENSWW